MSSSQFVGVPCLQHSNYLFYKTFKYKRDDNLNTLSVGDFFFLKILQDLPVCIGEIELLWEDKTSNYLLSSLRLYFEPDHTPDGRNTNTGEDEVVALGERVVLRLDDLLPLIQHRVTWNYGNSPAIPGTTPSHVTPGQSKPGHTSELLRPAGANVAVMSYSKYCRYRAVMRRLEGCENEWLHVAVVMAIGGFSARAPGCRVMFCRDSFYNSDIDYLDVRMDHLFPVLKKAKVKKTGKTLLKKESPVHDSDSMEEIFANVTPSISTSSRPRRAVETSQVGDDKVSTDEQAFLFGLHKFMHDSKMPIGRIPSLGFKQIDLYYFYKQAEKLGGYDMITTKRMWKHLYDKLGGNSSNTSAATCTRKHYERLLLPYERQLMKQKSGSKPKKKHKHRHKHKDKLTLQGEGQSQTIKSFKDNNKDISDSSSHKENIEQNDNKEGLANAADSEDSKIEVKRETFGSSLGNVEVKCEPPAVAAKPPTSTDSVKSQVLEVPPLKIKLPITKKSCVETKKLSSDKEIPVKENAVKEIPVKDVAVKDSPVKCESAPLVKPGIDSKPVLDTSVTQDVKPSVTTGPPAPSPLAALAPSDQVTQQFPAAAALMYRPGGSFMVQGLAGGHQVLSPWALPVLTAQGLQAQALQPVLQPTVAVSQVNPALRETKNTVPPPAGTPTGRPKVDHPLSVNPVGLSRPSGSGIVSGVTPSTFSQQQKPPPVSAHSHPKQQSAGNTLKAAHTNSHKPTPYMLEDHIQPTKETLTLPRLSVQHGQGSRYPHPNDLLRHTSHSLAPIMHPTPPGHKCQLSLPPAPSSIFLDPSSTNPFAPLPPQPINASPPSAHSQPRKRPYPFDSLNVLPSPTPGPPASVFPSPDMVLSRIKNSTAGLPRSNSSGSRPSNKLQRFEDPRDIFRQTSKPFTPASQNTAAPPPRKSSQFVNDQPSHSRQLLNQKPSKTSLSASTSSSLPPQSKQPHPRTSQPTNSQLYLPYGALPPGQSLGALQIQKSLQQQMIASTSTNSLSAMQHNSNKKHVQQGAGLPAHSSNNGILQVPQQAASKAMISSHMLSQQPPQFAAVGKDGRLTSALFGTQFTALPRSNASDKVPVPTSIEASTNAATAASLSTNVAAALSLNPHLHPAFMSPYLPSAATAAPSVNPQLQMLAGAYTPVQLAAYEELLRQNGFGAYLQGAVPSQAKVTKKN